MIIETKRLILREYTMDDYNDLLQILTDSETMKYYTKKYTENDVIRWINWNLDNYQKYGFGLYAIILKENKNFIGDCGITYQNINGNIKPEIGYHINKNFWRQGYASEAAQAWRDYAFKNLSFNELYSYMNKENIASVNTAKKNNMKYVEEYLDSDGSITVVYRILKTDWLKEYEKEGYK